MKKIAIFTALLMFLSSQTYAATSSFKTYTPFNQNDFYAYNRFLPPPPRPMTRAERNMIENRFHQPYNDYYNYTTPKKSFRQTITNFFGGQMTGYTPNTNAWSTNSWNNNYPYGYQNYNSDNKGNYYYNNYDHQTGGSVRILD